MSIEFKISCGYVSLIYKNKEISNVLNSEPIADKSLSDCILKLIKTTNIDGLL